MDYEKENIHTADLDEVKERLDIAMNDSDYIRPDTETENVLAGMVALSVVLRDYADAPELADVIATTRQIVADTYTLGYRWVVDGRDPQRDKHRMVGVSTYLAKWRDYRTFSPAKRITILWDDIILQTVSAATTLESVLAQKYRSYGGDCAIHSLIGALYGLLAMFDRYHDRIMGVAENADCKDIDPEEKLLVKEYLEDDSLLTPHAELAANAIKFGRGENRKVVDVLGDGTWTSVGQISMQTGIPPVEVRAELDDLLKKLKVIKIVGDDEIPRFCWKRP